VCNDPIKILKKKGLRETSEDFTAFFTRLRCVGNILPDKGGGLPHAEEFLKGKTEGTCAKADNGNIDLGDNRNKPLAAREKGGLRWNVAQRRGVQGRGDKKWLTQGECDESRRPLAEGSVIREIYELDVLPSVHGGTTWQEQRRNL